MRAALALTALVSGAFLAHVLLAEPDYGRRPRLAAVVDGGKMEEFLEDETEKETILRWVEDGASESEWSAVSAVLESRCSSCHYTGASFEVLPLDRYDDAARAAKVLPVLLEKVTGGSMGKYLETAETRNQLAAWIEAGAPESGWPPIAVLLQPTE